MVMSRSRRFLWGTVIVLLTALAGAGTWALGHASGTRDPSETTKMTEHMKTLCVGRFLVDVPAHAEVRFSHEMIDGFAINTVEESEAAFRKRLAAREAGIGSYESATERRGTSGMVEARALRLPHVVGRVLVYGRTKSHSMDGNRRIDDEWVTVEAHAHVQGVSLALSMQYANQSDAEDAEALLARMRLRDPDGIPGERGFCTQRAVFVEPLPPHKTEHVVMHLGLPGHPDLGMAFSIMPGASTERSLLKRVAETDAQASADETLRVTKLRSHKRSIHGIDGDEVLERVRELNFTTGYAFVWEAQGVQNDNLHPYLLLNMETGSNSRPSGEPVDSSLHQDAALALWDRISSSIRPQPDARPGTGAHVPTAAAAPDGVPTRR